MTAASSPGTIAAGKGEGGNPPATTNISNVSKPKPHSRGTSVWVAKSELAKVESQTIPKTEAAPENDQSSSRKNPVVSDEGAGKKSAAAGDPSPGKATSRKNNEDNNNRKKGNAAKQQQHMEKDKAASDSSTEQQRRENSQSSSTTSSLSRQISLSKLNAAAAVFVPKISSSLPSSLGGFHAGQPGVISLPHSSLAPLTDGEEILEPPPANIAASQKPVALTDELRSQIVQQAEFYFSDGNLSTDNYLMKFMKKDPDGYVPIALVGSFKKMRNLTKNHAAIAVALRTSSKLVVSDDGKKVKRAEPLEDGNLDDIQSRTVVAENLPADHSVQNLERLFGAAGTVKSVRVCEPETVNGMNQQMGKHKVDRLVSNKLHALVEYETVEQAEKAVAELTDQRNWRSGLHVRLLLRRIYPASKQHHNNNNHQHAVPKARKNNSHEGNNNEGAVEEDSSTAVGDAADIENPVEITNSNANDDAGGDSAAAEGGGGGGKRGGRGGMGRAMGRGRGRGRGMMLNGMLGTSPQLGTSLSEAPVVNKPPPGPRMPDGTKGFTFGRGTSIRDRTVVVSSSSS